MLDHLVYATPDLDATVAELTERLHTAPEPGGSHPGLGTRNALVDLGNGSYLEIVGPDPRQADPPTPRPFGIDRLDGAALVAWCARPEQSLDGAVAAARAAGYDPGDPIAMSRVRPDGVRLDWQLTLPRLDAHGGVLPFLIDWGRSPHPTETLALHVTLVQLRIETPDAEAVLAILSALGAADGVEVVEESRPALSCLVRTEDGVLGIR